MRYVVVAVEPGGGKVSNEVSELGRVTANLGRLRQLGFPNKANVVRWQ